MYSITGHVSVTSIMRIHQSGILEWWQNLVANAERFGGTKQLSQEELLPRVDMTGNVCLVFIVWLGGLGITICTFSAELILKIGSHYS